MNHRIFTLNLLAYTVVLLLLCLLTSLGFWQLHRADEKRVILAEFEGRSSSPPLSFEEAFARDTESLRYFPIALKGHFDNHHSILLDNRPFKGHVGYEVLTPFWVEGADVAVMVNRGWIPRGRDRTVLPEVLEIEGEQALQGTILLPPSKVFRLGPEEAGESWPWRMQNLSLEAITARLKYTIAPFVVAFDAHEFRPVYMTPDRHVGYAVQWFALAITLLVCFSIFKLRTNRE